MTIRFAERLSRLGTESAFEVLAHARRLEAEGRSIVHLEIGEPDFATPDNIIDAAVRAMREGATHYTPASGIREVRERTAAYVTRHTGVPTQFENIVLTPGSKNLLLFALLALVEEGDEVIVPDPGYAIYRSLTEFIGATAVSLPLLQANDFRIDVAELRGLITPRTRMLVVNSPQNPTGGILTRDDCEQLARIAIEHDLVVLSDEIYNRLSYDAAHVSLYGIEGMAERTIYMDGLSKAWAMCGWRLGFGAMPVEIARKMDTLMINSSSCAAAFTQWAAVEAFDSPESDAAVDSPWWPSSSADATGSSRSSMRSPASTAAGRREPSTFSRISPPPASPIVSWRPRSSTRSASPCCPVPPSAATGAATSASATQPPSPTSRRRRVASPITSAPPRSRDDPSMARRR